MSGQVPVSFAQKFRGDFLMLSQQKGSLLENTVRRDPDFLNGKYGHWNRIGETEPVEIPSRHADTQLIDTPHSRRRISLRHFAWADMIDKQDAVQMLESGSLPMRYAENARWGMGRKKDTLIVAAAEGNAFAIDEDEAATAVPLPAGQKITTSGGLTLDKIEACRELFALNDVDPDEEKFWAIGPKETTQLFGITEFKSIEFNSNKPLTEGRILGKFMGFNWIELNRLTLSGSTRQTLAWARNGLGIAFGMDITTDIGPRRDKNMNLQVLLTMSMDATRIEDEKVVQVNCTES